MGWELHVWNLGLILTTNFQICSKSQNFLNGGCKHVKIWIASPHLFAILLVAKTIDKIILQLDLRIQATSVINHWSLIWLSRKNETHWKGFQYKRLSNESLWKFLWWLPDTCYCLKSVEWAPRLHGNNMTIFAIKS